MKLPQIPHDKANHFIYGCVICYLADFKFSAIVCLLVVIIVGILTEVWDYYHKGKVEVLDFVATIAPGLFMVLKTFIICPQ